MRIEIKGLIDGLRFPWRSAVFSYHAHSDVMSRALQRVLGYVTCELLAEVRSINTFERWKYEHRGIVARNVPSAGSRNSFRQRSAVSRAELLEKFYAEYHESREHAETIEYWSRITHPSDLHLYSPVREPLQR